MLTGDMRNSEADFSAGGTCSGFVFSGRVVEGKRLGRTLGFPTANIRPEGPADIPAGVFACLVFVPGFPLKGGMLNVGTRPTVEDSGERSIEANLFDFSGDLYGKDIKVLILAKIRDEQKFPDLDSLRRRLEKDRDRAKALIGEYAEKGGL